MNIVAIGKIKLYEDQLNINSSPTKTKHRLEYRNQNSIIKEFCILEDRAKLLQLQLNTALEEKKLWIEVGSQIINEWRRSAEVGGKLGLHRGRFKVEI